MAHSKTTQRINETEAQVTFTGNNGVEINALEFTDIRDFENQIYVGADQMAEEFCAKHTNYVIVGIGGREITVATKEDAKKIGLTNAKPTMR